MGGGTGIKQQAPVPAPPHAHCLPESVLPPPHHLATTMTLDIQAPFFFLLLLFLTGEGRKVGRGSSQPFCGFCFLGDGIQEAEVADRGGPVCARIKNKGVRPRTG